jgi:hypothetical protein
MELRIRAVAQVAVALTVQFRQMVATAALAL